MGQRLINKLCDFLIGQYYFIAIIFYSCTFWKVGFSVGLYSAGIMFLIGAFVVLCSRRKSKIAIIDALVILYVIYCVGTIIFYWANEISVVVFLKAISNSLLPIVFYWAAKRNSYTFYNVFWWTNGLCCSIGVVLLFVMPTWYFLYCIEYGYSFTRLSSCIGSTGIGSMSVIAVIIAIQILYSTKGKKGKIQYIISIFFAFASMQRSAWIVVSLTLVVAHIFIFFKWRVIKLQYLMVEVIVGIISLIILKDQIVSMITRWLAEQSVVADAGYDTGMFASRTASWNHALKNSNIIWGEGYGAVGHKAFGYVDNIVADGSWVCLLCEIGIMGMLLFVTIIFYVIVKGIKNIKVLFMPLGIVICIAMQAIGSNLFEYQLIMPIFWYAIGHIASYKEVGKEC